MSDYNLFAREYHEDAKKNLFERNNAKLERDIIDRAKLNLYQINKLLVIGGASGIEVKFMIENLGNVKQITSIDSSTKLINLAKKEFPNPKITYNVSQMEMLSFDSSTFDFIYSRNSIHYSNDLKSTFSESFRVLTNKGMMYFVVAHPTWVLLNKKSKNYFNRDKVHLNIQSGKINVEHFAYTVSDYVTSISKAGFKIIELAEYEGTRSNINGYKVPTGLGFKLEKII